jgi:hypothetical protein
MICIANVGKMWAPLVGAGVDKGLEDRGADARLGPSCAELDDGQGGSAMRS